MPFVDVWLSINGSVSKYVYGPNDIAGLEAAVKVSEVFPRNLSHDWVVVYGPRSPGREAGRVMEPDDRPLAE